MIQLLVLSSLAGWLAGLFIFTGPVQSASPGSVVYLPNVVNNAPLAMRSTYPSGAVGYDVSWPNCGQTPPPDSSLGTAYPYRFAVIGVSDGLSFSQNPCLGPEFDAAVGQGLTISFYMNINGPPDWTSPRATTGPKSCAATDQLCLGYNYGYNAAQDAYRRTVQALGATEVGQRLWWLDVEIANTWNDQSSNGQVVQGALDYFKGQDLYVGAYSTGGMWAQGIPSARATVAPAPGLLPQVVGGYRPPIPAWLSVQDSLANARSSCQTASFTGGPIWLVQAAATSPQSGLDEDYAC